MRYSIRNSLILLTILILLVAGGWGYLHFIERAKTEHLQQTLQNKKKTLATIQNKSGRYNHVQHRLDSLQNKYLNLQTELFPSESQSVIYGYLNSLNTNRAYIDYDLNYRDTKTFGRYGWVRTTLKGNGDFRHLINFIASLEHSAPLNKITTLRVEGNSSPGQLGHVEVTMELQSYFYTTPTNASGSRIIWVAKNNTPLYTRPNKAADLVIHLKNGYPLQYENSSEGWSHVSTGSMQGWIPNSLLAVDDQSVPYPETNVNTSYSHNIFYPLIHAVPSNSRDLLEPAKSKLIGLTNTVAYLLDQHGKMRTLNIGDAVYLGRLRSIDQQRQQVVFSQNKGGIYTTVTLKVNNSPSGNR